MCVKRLCAPYADKTAGLAACRTRHFQPVDFAAGVCLSIDGLENWVGLSFDGDRLACSAALMRAENAVRPASGGAKDEHPLHIPGHGHKAPLAADTVDPAQQKLAEAQHRLDDAEHRFRHLLA